MYSTTTSTLFADSLAQPHRIERTAGEFFASPVMVEPFSVDFPIAVDDLRWADVAGERPFPADKTLPDEGAVETSPLEL